MIGVNWGEVRYFVIHPSGQRYGPAEVAVLNQWAMEGRLAPTSLLADETTGQQFQASQIPGLIFQAPPGGPQQFPQQGPGGYGSPLGGQSGPTVPYSLTGNNAPQQGYGQQGNPYATPSGYFGGYVPYQDGTAELNNSYIASGLSLALSIVCCIPFGIYISVLAGIAGVVFAFIAKGKGANAGGAVALGFVALVVSVGMIILEQWLMQSFLGR